jgi:outer membrane biosynthesis protein TonB
MQPHLFSSLRFWLALVLLTALASIHVADFSALVDTPPEQRHDLPAVTPATVDQAVEEALRRYAYDQYRNIVDASLFAINPVKPEKVVVIEPPPPPPPAPPPPPKPKPKPFTANLEVTGIAITPERKLVMVWDKNKQETHVLAERERIQRWRVVSIDRQRVILRHPLGGRYEFIVNEDTLVDVEN